MVRYALAAVLAVISFCASAGQACTERSPGPADVREALLLAFDVSRVLDRNDAHVAILARVGRDLSKYGFRYSHVGIAWRDHPRHDWTVVEELNACGTAESALFDDGLGDFFLDDMFEYEAKVVIPSPAVQRKIGALLSAGEAGRLHEPRYNLVAYPWSTRYQNSNQWVLESVAAALAGRPISDRAGAQAWLRTAGYRATTISLSALERLGGELTRANIAFDDHPVDRRMVGDIAIVSAESVLDFVQRIDADATVRIIRSGNLDASPMLPARPSTDVAPAGDRQ